MPVTMRATPTVAYAGAFNMLEVNAGSRAVTSASGAFLTNGDSAYLVLDASGGGMTSPNMVFITEQGNIDFSAEL
jgi:hypothetical protein